MRKEWLAMTLAFGLAVSLPCEIVPVWAAEEKVASADEMTDVEEVIEDWMEPVPVSDLRDGTYEIAVNCSSSMFKIADVTLTVEEGEAHARLHMGGTGYLYVYPGTAKEAAAADESDLIPYTEEADGSHSFEIPVESLDSVVHCAAFSKRKEKWYDRDLAFVSVSLPSDAFLEGRGTGIEALALEDGEYLVGATLEGGSGRTSIESPARLSVKDGQVTMTVIFSSPNYDYMLVDAQRYEPVNEEGNSTFEIPLSAFDVPVAVKADTVAMSKPHEIDYTITVDSSTLSPASHE